MISPEELELGLRREGKEHCVYCGENLRGSMISTVDFKRIIEGVQKPVCFKCKIRRDRQKLFLIVAIAVVGVGLLAFFIFN